MNNRKTSAIVLRRTNFGEADRILQLLTPDGKCSVMARGVRREKSRLAGGIELFSICDVVIAKGKGDLDLLTSSRLSHFYKNIVNDFDRMQFAYTVIKLVSNASEMVDGGEWYDVLADVLMGLDSVSLDIELTQAWFYLRHAALTGYELSLWNDITGQKITADKLYRYDVSERGLSPDSSGGLSSNHIKLLRLLATKPLKAIANIGGTSSIIGECLTTARQHASL